jgi:hypothetical protein
MSAGRQSLPGDEGDYMLPTAKKNKSLIWLPILATMIILGSCTMPSFVFSLAKKATIDLSISGTISPASYDIKGTGPAGETFARSSSSSTATISGLSSGDWTVNVVAKDVSNQSIGQGAGQVSLNEGGESPLTVAVASNPPPPPPPAGTVTHGADLTTANTGVPAGTVLSDVSGTLTVTDAWIASSNGGSRVIQNKNFLSGSSVVVNASGVTIQFSKFTGSASIRSSTNSTADASVLNLTVRYCEFDGQNMDGGGNTPIGIGTGAPNYSNVGIALLERNYMHNYSRQLNYGEARNVIIRENLFTDLYMDGSGTHIENLYIGGGDHIQIIRNKFVTNPVGPGAANPTSQISACVAIYNESWNPQFTRINYVTIQDNWFEGGAGFGLYGGAVASKLAGMAYGTNMTITGNVWGRNFYRFSCSFGPATAFNNGDSANTWSNNTWGPRGPFWKSGDPDLGAAVTAPPPS